MPDDNKPDYFSGIRDHFTGLETKIFKGVTATDVNVLIDVIIEKACDKDGNKMFDATNILGFRTKADTNIIAEVANKIMGTQNVDVNDNKKN